MNNECIKKAFDLKEEGLSFKDISDEVDIPYTTLSSMFKKHTDERCAICKNCGKLIFHPIKQKKKKFCNDKCRMDWWNNHMDEVNRQAYYEGVCENCGKEFVYYGKRTRKYCCRRCFDTRFKP